MSINKQIQISCKSGLHSKHVGLNLTMLFLFPFSVLPAILSSLEMYKKKATFYLCVVHQLPVRQTNKKRVTLSISASFKSFVIVLVSQWDRERTAAAGRHKNVKLFPKSFKYLISFHHFESTYVEPQWEINALLRLLSCSSLFREHVLLLFSPRVSQVYPGGGCSQPELSHQSKHKCTSGGPGATWFSLSLCLFLCFHICLLSKLSLSLAHFFSPFQLEVKTNRNKIANNMCWFQKSSLSFPPVFFFPFSYCIRDDLGWTKNWHKTSTSSKILAIKLLNLKYEVHIEKKGSKVQNSYAQSLLRSCFKNKVKFIFYTWCGLRLLGA